MERRSSWEPSSAELQSLADVVRGAFPHASADTMHTLVTSAEIRYFRPRETVLPQGDDSRVGLILEGHIGFRRTTVDGREIMTRIVSRGHLGPVLPIARRPSTDEFLALSAGRVALWPGSLVQALASRDAGLAIALLEDVLLAVEEMVERMDGLLYQGALRRVARVLERYSDIVFGDEVHFPRAYLPALVGTSREMTGRVLRQLEAEGVVERLGRGRLRLVDASRLALTADASSRSPDAEARNMFLAGPRRAMQE